MDFITTANGIIALLTGLCGLIGTGVGAYFAIKAVIQSFKEKSTRETWSMIMKIADAAIIEAEKSGKAGAEKKEMVLNAVKAGAKAAGIDIDAFIDQLSAYIDECIKFVNNMKTLDIKSEEVK